MPDKRDLPPETEATIVTRYLAGEKAGALAKEYQINRKTVTTMVKRAGHKPRHQGADAGAPRFKDEKYATAVAELRGLGMAQTAIGKQLGMSQAVVCRILTRLGLPTETHRRGEKHGSWKGGRSVTEEGYVLVMVEKTDPMYVMANLAGYVPEHRLVKARELGRPLTRNESVHHIDGDKQNNKPDNLQLRHGKHGTGICLQCADCGSINLKSVELAA